MNEQKNIFTSDLDKIMKVISNTNFCYLLVYKETQRISVIVKIDLGKNIIVNTMFYNGFIDEIVFDEENKMFVFFFIHFIFIILFFVVLDCLELIKILILFAWRGIMKSS